MAKWNRGARIVTNKGVKAEVKFTDSSSGRYVLETDDGKEFGAMESDIKGVDNNPAPKKANWLERRKKSR